MGFHARALRQRANGVNFVSLAAEAQFANLRLLPLHVHDHPMYARANNPFHLAAGHLRRHHLMGMGQRRTPARLR